MSDNFVVTFTYGGYRHRGYAVVEAPEDGNWYFKDLEVHLPRKDNDCSWVDVSYLLDTPAYESIYEAADEVVWGQWNDYLQEEFVEPYYDEECI